MSSLFQWSPTLSKPVLSISLIVGRLYIRISLTTRENTLVARDGEGFMEVAMLLRVLIFWGLLARPAGRSDWTAENYPARTSRVMRKAGAARLRLAEKLDRVCILFIYVSDYNDLHIIKGTYRTWISYQTLISIIPFVWNITLFGYASTCIWKDQIISLGRWKLSIEIIHRPMAGLVFCKKLLR